MSVAVNLHRQAISFQANVQGGDITCGALVLGESGANDPSCGVIDVGVKCSIALPLAKPLEPGSIGLPEHARSPFAWPRAMKFRFAPDARTA